MNWVNDIYQTHIEFIIYLDITCIVYSVKE